MREAFASLTTRGLSFFSAGVVCAIAGVVLGHQELFRIAVFLIALPLVAALLLSRARYRLASARTITPARVEAGQPAEVAVRVENVSRIPTGVMFLEESLPYALGGRPRFVVDRLTPRESRTITYPIRSENRGRFGVGPLTIRLADPLGLCELVRSFRTTDTVLVTPPITRLPSVRIAGSWNGGGESTSRSVAASGEDDIATREYRFGDDLRRVHWRSTAKAGELMVRREEQPWHTQAALVLDNRASAHRGEGAQSSFEHAVRVAASVAVHLARSSYQLQLASGLRDSDDDPVLLEPADEAVALDRLAEVRTSPVRSLLPLLEQLDTSDQLVVAVLGDITHDEAMRLARMRRRAVCVAVLIDTVSWVSLPAKEKLAAESDYRASALLLEQAGWRVLMVDRTTPLERAWAGLSVSAPAGAVTAAAAAGRK